MSRSVDVKQTLQNADLHDQWISAYRTAENERFFEAAFDYIAGQLGAAPGARMLDAGCGSCAHSMRLARRGFVVHAVDFSEHILDTARANVREAGLADRITVGQEDILSLSLPDTSFDYALCWGVLMHIPDVERAVSELARVLREGGRLVISEANMRSLQAVSLRTLKRLLRRERAEVVRTPVGLEYWHTRPSGRLVTRQNDNRAFRNILASAGLSVERHVSGQFTELYTVVGSRAAKRCIHALNQVWFNRVRMPQLSFGNIWILRKSS